MIDFEQSCSEIVASLTPYADSATALPGPPLAFLGELHRLMLRFVLTDLSCAQRIAALSWEIAQQYRDEALVQAQAHWTRASAIAYIPDVANALAHYDQALAWYAQAREAVRDEPPLDVRVVQIVRVFCLTELGRYREALDAASLAEAWLADHPQPYALLTLLLNRSLLAGQMGEYSQMATLADATIALADRLGEAARAAQGWINRGIACTYLGSYQEADAALDRGATLASAAGERLTLARAHWNRARLLRRQGKLFAALHELRSAQAGLAQAPNEAATVALEEAGLYEQLRQLPEARQAAMTAATKFAQQSMSAYSAEAALIAARIAVEQGREQLANTQLTLAVEQARLTALPALNAEIDLIQALLVTLPAPGRSVQVRRSRWQHARDLARAAVDRLVAAGLVREATEGELIVARLNLLIGEKQAAITTYLALVEHQDQQVAMRACAGLGSLLRSARGLPYLKRAAELATAQRRVLPAEELQARFSSETSIYHLALAERLLTLDNPVAALAALWEAKAGPLLDMRSAAAGLDKAELERLGQARAELAKRRELVALHRRRAWEAGEQEHHEQELYHTKQAELAQDGVRASEQRLTEAVRVFGDKAASVHIPVPDEVLAMVPPGTALLEFADVGGRLLAVLLRAGRAPEVQALGTTTELDPLLDRWKLVYYRLSRYPALDTTEQIAAATAPLWSVLIGPWAEALADTETLIVAPYGVLYHVPWAGLWDGDAFLGERYTLMLTPSVGMWAAPYHPPPAAGPPRLLGYSGPEERRLIHSEAELRAVAALYDGAELVLGATSEDLRAMPAPRLLHIAAHALTSPSAPICSAVELADGPFLLIEIHRLDLRGTELVTLSACETGVRPDHGDVALALAGAFLCAGARGVLASLWAITDTAAAALMASFYRELAAGASPAVALRAAQRAIGAAYPLDRFAFQLWVGAS